MLCTQILLCYLFVSASDSCLQYGLHPTKRGKTKINAHKVNAFRNSHDLNASRQFPKELIFLSFCLKIERKTYVFSLDRFRACSEVKSIDTQRRTDSNANTSAQKTENVSFSKVFGFMINQKGHHLNAHCLPKIADNPISFVFQVPSVSHK